MTNRGLVLLIINITLATIIIGMIARISTGLTIVVLASSLVWIVLGFISQRIDEMKKQDESIRTSRNIVLAKRYAILTLNLIYLAIFLFLDYFNIQSDDSYLWPTLFGMFTLLFLVANFSDLGTEVSRAFPSRGPLSGHATKNNEQ